MPDLNHAPNTRDIGSRMKSVRFHGRGDLRLDELTLPEPGPGEVRLRPLAAGVCGTDTHILKGEFPASAPVVLGHEVAGVVDAVGGKVDGLAEGDLVSVQPNTFCGVCRYCRSAREHLCTDLRAYGVHLNGGFSQAMVVSSRAVYRLPSSVDARLGCLAEPLACCIHGMDRLNMRSGSTVLIIGAGLIGLMLTRLSRLAGAGVIIVSEPQESRRKSALQFGADEAVDPGQPSDRMPGTTQGRGFDCVIDAVGAPATFEQAVNSAARGGTILLFGVAAMQATASIRPFEVYARELTIVGSFINPYTHDRAVGLLPQMGLDKLNINAFPLENFQDAFAAQARGGSAKIEILPQG